MSMDETMVMDATNADTSMRCSMCCWCSYSYMKHMNSESEREREGARYVSLSLSVCVCIYICVCTYLCYLRMCVHVEEDEMRVFMQWY